jgi:hypothetical protein
MNTRTAVEFKMQSDIWPVIEQWAQAENFAMKESLVLTSRLYQRGSGFMTAPMRFQATTSGDTARLEMWVYVPFFNRLSALFLVPEEMGVESGGLRLSVPRNIARKSFNKLLAHLGRTPIS